MKFSVKSFQAIAACLFLMESCVVTSVTDEIESTVKSQDPPQMGLMTIKLENKAENTCLQIDSVEICNVVMLSDGSNFQTYRGNVTAIKPASGATLPEGASISSKEIKLPQQIFNPWSPNTLPGYSNKQYIKIYGRIYTYGNNSTLILLSNSPMYTPLHGKIAENEALSTAVSLESNCPIYIENNGEMTKMLQEITFNVSINDWEEEAQ